MRMGKGIERARMTAVVGIDGGSGATLFFN